ncbi:Thioredoxin domain-containing protein [[Candida] zeylanoides]
MRLGLLVLAAAVAAHAGIDGIPVAPGDIGLPAMDASEDGGDARQVAGVAPPAVVPVAEPEAMKPAPPDVPNGPSVPAGVPGAPAGVPPDPPGPHDDIVPEDEDEEVTAAKAQAAAKAAKAKLPPSLTLNDFDAVVSERLSFVEFYSPYCKHCQLLAPVWEQTYAEFLPEMTRLNIQMRQVNCVENGDLCEREDINFYPNLRLYAPARDPQSKEIVPGKHRNVAAFPRAILRTVDNFKKYLQNAVAEYDDGSIDMPSSSEQLTTDSMLQIVAGEVDEPIFVSFFPTSDEKWAVADETGRAKDVFARGCFDCLEYKQLWDKLSNQVISSVRTGHLNCFSHPVLCASLGFKMDDRTVEPKFVMFLPKTTGLVRLDYQGEINLALMKRWCVRLRENFGVEKIKMRALSDILEVKKSLPFEPLNSYYPLTNKMVLMYYYDEDPSDEDKAILPYLLREVMASPFNIHLYQSSDPKLDKFVQSQAKNVIEYISYDDAADYKYNNPMFLATHLTSKPTLMMFKENTLFTPIFQNFAIEDMRDPKKISRFIRQNQFPLYQELELHLMSTYFPGDAKFDYSKKSKEKRRKGAKMPDPTNDKVVVAFIDSRDAAHTNEALYNMSLAAHEYNYVKREYYYNRIVEERQQKKEWVEGLVRSGAKSVAVIEAMRREVPHLFANDEVLFTFIDLATNPHLAEAAGWDVSGQNYSVGDAIVVSKHDKWYWNTNVGGARLRNDPYELQPLLKHLLDPRLVDTPVAARRLLIGSPWGNALRFMDRVHQHGFKGYVALVAAVCAALWAARRMRRRRGRIPRADAGLGLLDKKD